MAFMAWRPWRRRASSGRPPLHRLGERVAPPIEQPIPCEKEKRRRGDARQKTQPMSDWTVEEEKLLVRDGQVRERIEVEQNLEPLHLVLKPRVDDGSREEPQGQEVGENVADIPEVDRERSNDQREGGREDQFDD